MEIRLEELPIGRQLRLRREALGLKQWQVAQRLGVQAIRVCECEREDGDRALPYIRRLRQQLDAALPRLTVGAAAHDVGATTTTTAASAA